MTIRELKERKKDLGYTNEMIAERSGVPLSTVQKVFSGQTSAPRYKTLEAIEAVLRPGKNMTLYEAAAASLQKKGEVREESAAYQADLRQGTYTVDDYMAIPDERRVELIDGYIYDLAAPSFTHQLILGELYKQFAPCEEKHPDCAVFFSPIDVWLGDDRRTVVQPDLAVFCHEIREKRFRHIVPDFIIEIVSPSGRYHDMFRKLHKYMESGVREYWIVEPKERKIIVYDFENEKLPESYTFKDTVPVGISNGECKIDFSRILTKMEKIGDQ